MDCLEQQDFSHQTGADLLVYYLQQLEAEFVFTIPGGSAEPLFNALANQTQVRPILARHESGAAYIAQGYAQATGQLGICVTTTGPGASNATTGIYAAKEQQSPLLLITAQTPTYRFGQGAFQDSSTLGMNSLALFENACRFNTMVTDIKQLETSLATAVLTALGQPKGPVHLSLPSNILLQSVKCSPQFHLPKLLKQTVSWNKKVEKLLCNELTRSRNPLFIIGEECINCISSIIKLAEKLSITMISTPGAAGLLNPHHPLHAGVYGFAGHASADETLQQSDKIFVLGSCLDEWDGGWNPALYKNLVYHISANQSALNRSLKSHYRIYAELDEVVNSLTYKFSDFPHPKGWHPKILPRKNDTQYLDSETVNPSTLMQYLSTHCPVGCRFYADTGNSSAWAIHYLRPWSYVSNWLYTSTHFGAMGWGIGSAIGAALAEKGPVICITGDGSMLMNGSELSVAVDENISILIFILNDSSLGMVRHGQKLGNAADISNRLPETDFCLYAQAMGANSIRIKNDYELEKLNLTSLINHSGPCVIDVQVNNRSVPPINKRVEVLQQ